MASYAIPISKASISSQIEFHDNAVTDSTGNIYITGKYKYDSTRVLNNNITVDFTGADSFVLLKIDQNGSVVWAKTMNDTSSIDHPILYMSSTSVIMLAFIDKGAASYLQIMRVQFNGTQSFNKMITVSNINNNAYYSINNILLRSAYDSLSDKIYCSFIYISATPITVDGFTMPATGSYAYQALLKLYGTSGEVQLGRVFQINTSINTMNNYTIDAINAPGIAISKLLIANNDIYVVGSNNLNTSYQLPASPYTLDSTTRMFICTFTNDLVAKALYKSTLDIEIDNINVNVATTTHLFIPITYIATTPITFEQVTLPQTVYNTYVPNKSILLKVNLTLTSVLCTLVDLPILNITQLNNNIYLTTYLFMNNSDNTSYTYSHTLIKYDTTLTKKAETLIGNDTYLVGTVSLYDPYRILTSSSAIYIIGGMQPIIKKYDLNANLIWSKGIPYYMRQLSGAISSNNDIYIMGNIQTSENQRLDYNLLFESTNNVVQSFFMKYAEPRVLFTANKTSVATYLNIRLNPYIYCGIPYRDSPGLGFIVRKSVTNADRTQSSGEVVQRFTGTYAGASSLAIGLLAGINKITISYIYHDGSEINISEPVYIDNLASYLSTSYNNINTSTPQQVRTSLNQITDSNKGSYTFNASGSSLTSSLLTRVTALNNYQLSGQDIHADGVQTLKRITVADPNVFGIFSETTSTSTPSAQTTITYKLTKVTSAGVQILSNVNDPATFDTIVATVPKPKNGIINVDRIINSTRTPNVASININTGATTITWSGQQISVLATTATTVTISYKGPFSENEFLMDETVSQDTVVESSIPCLPSGTRVLTPTGYRLVETLYDGDTVVTAAGKAVPIRMYSQHVAVATEKTAPYLIPAKTFGPSQKATICLSPLHAVSIGKGLWEIPMYAAARYPGIRQYGLGEQVTYYHIETPNFFQDNLVIEGGVVVEAFAGHQCDGLKKLYTFDRKRGAFTRASPPSAVAVAKRG